MSMMLSPPKGLDKIQVNVLSDVLKQIGRSRAHLFSTHTAMWSLGGTKRLCQSFVHYVVCS